MKRVEAFSSFQDASARAKELSHAKGLTVKVYGDPDGHFKVEWYEEPSLNQTVTAAQDFRATTQQSLQEASLSPATKQRASEPFYEKTYVFPNGYGGKTRTGWIGALVLSVSLACLPFYLLYHLVVFVLWFIK